MKELLCSFSEERVTSVPCLAWMNTMCGLKDDPSRPALDGASRCERGATHQRNSKIRRQEEQGGCVCGWTLDKKKAEILNWLIVLAILMCSFFYLLNFLFIIHINPSSPSIPSFCSPYLPSTRPPSTQPGTLSWSRTVWMEAHPSPWHPYI